MKIIYFRKIDNLYKYNQNHKIESGKYHCLYFGNKNRYVTRLLNDLKLKVYFPTDFNVDKEDFKHNYLSLIDNLTSTFSNKYWWATETVSKFRSPLLVLLHKFQIVLSVVEKYQPEKLIVIDEEIIFERLLYHYSIKENVEFICPFMNVRKVICKIKVIILFYFKMIRSFVGLIYKIFLCRYYFKEKLKNQSTQKKYVIIKSFAYERSFVNKNQYVDPFFGNLSAYLIQNKHNVMSVVSCLGNYKKIIKKLFNIENIVYPCELFISPLKLIITFIKVITLRLKVKENIYFNKINLSQFINEYLSLNKVNELSLNQTLYFDSMNRMLKIFKSEIFISTYENMPWEPMCYLGIKDASPETKIIGCQHTVVSEFSTNYFLYDNELKNRQLPDKICTVGPVTKRIIERNCGYNHPPIESACALRYQHLKQEDVRFRRNKRKILVALEGIDDVYKLVNYVCNELSQNDNIEIIIRPHPILPLSKIDKNIDIDYTKLNYVKISSNDSITKDLEKVSVVIYRESAVALEAIAFGIPVVCFMFVSSLIPLFHMIHCSNLLILNGMLMNQLELSQY